MQYGCGRHRYAQAMCGVAFKPGKVQRLVTHEIERPHELPAVIVGCDRRCVVGDDVVAQIVIVFGDAIEHDPSHPIRKRCGKFAGDTRTGVRTVNVDARQLECIEKAAHAVGEICDVGFLDRRRNRVAVAERVGCDQWRS